MNVNAITIKTNDVDRLLEFYCKVFNVPDNNKISYDETHKGFSLDNLYLGFEKTDTRPSESNIVIWFNAYKVEEIFEKFVKAGAGVVYKPTKEKSPREVLAQVKDPDGNIIGIIGPVLNEIADENLI